MNSALAFSIFGVDWQFLRPFVVIECAGLPGHSEIADTLEEALGSAEGGTLVLDAPAELPLAVQRELTPPIDAKAFRERLRGHRAQVLAASCAH